MGILFRLACLGALVGVSGLPRAEPPQWDFHNGDVVLQASKSERSELIRKASRSPFSHTGVIEVAKDGVYVIEAIAPVSRTPVEQWRKRGVGEEMTVLRFTGLDEAQGKRVVAEAKKLLGKPYDARYRWDEERIYCSELVVKAFARGADKSIGRQEQVKTLALGPEELALARKLGISPDQSLVTPGSLADDEQFAVVAPK
ncbi:MAG: YiiX/YebB-like N1pC/P60 family cysteine hydrolase [Myxococcaceae bacterium]